MTGTMADKENPPAIVMKGITKRFGPVQALGGVDLMVTKGSVHAIVGENGAGKSTLMKILAGVFRPDEGTIKIEGRPAEFNDPQQAIDAGISMIYQELDLAQHLTAAQNVFLGNEPKRFSFILDQKAMIQKTAELARRLNFDINPQAKIKDLSTSDCQVVEILKALMRHVSVLVMDEPTSSLSQQEAQRLFKIVKDLRKQGITIIYITHRLEEIINLADDITILRDGAVVHCETASNLSIGQIIRYMVGRELKDFFPSRKADIGRTLVKVKNLTAKAKVKDVSFEIQAGEVVGMAGLVGAGRTETACAVFGIDKKTSGSIYLDDIEIKISTPADSITNGIAYLTEDRKRTGLFSGLSCCWNITLPNLDAIGMAVIIKPAKENKIADDLSQRIGIKWPGPDAPIDSLSGGNQQKVLIARWLLAEARFLIFDEPTRGIDVGAKKEIYALLNSLAEQGKAILFISSELPELFGIADRILVMRRGRLVGNLRTNETSQEEVMHLAAVEGN